MRGVVATFIANTIVVLPKISINSTYPGGTTYISSPSGGGSVQFTSSASDGTHPNVVYALSDHGGDARIHGSMSGSTANITVSGVNVGETIRKDFGVTASATGYQGTSAGFGVTFHRTS